MRRFTILAITLALSGCDKGSTSEAARSPSPSPTTQAPAAAPAPVTGTTFGAGVKQAESVSIDKIIDDPAAFSDKVVRVEGLIADVCPKRGCWFDMAGDGPGKKMRFKVTDGEMVFPLDTKGKYAVAEGKVKVTEMSIEDSKAYAEYQAKEYGKPYDPASITKPTVVVRLDGTGAVFRDKK